jgi:IMP dehydrogenase
MIGGMLAGTKSTPGKVITKENGIKVKLYRGMASREAQETFLGPMPDWKTEEGVTTEVGFRDDEEAIIADIIGGLRSGLTYGGSKNIKELQRKLNYVLVSQAGVLESLPHKLLK